MIVTAKEQRLIRAIRETGCKIEFLLIHLANLYAKQAELDEKSDRDNRLEMRRRSDLFYQAYNEVMNVRTGQRNTSLYLVKNDEI